MASARHQSLQHRRARDDGLCQLCLAARRSLGQQDLLLRKQVGGLLQLVSQRGDLLGQTGYSLGVRVRGLLGGIGRRGLGRLCLSRLLQRRLGVLEVLLRPLSL